MYTHIHTLNKVISNAYELPNKDIYWLLYLASYSGFSPWLELFTPLPPSYTPIPSGSLPRTVNSSLPVSCPQIRPRCASQCQHAILTAATVWALHAQGLLFLDTVIVEIVVSLLCKISTEFLFDMAVRSKTGERVCAVVPLPETSSLGLPPLYYLCVSSTLCG